MSFIDSMLEKVGDMFGSGVPNVGARSPAGNIAQKKPFDFGLYMQAYGNFFDDFFSKKIPEFFSKPGYYMGKFPDWFGKLSPDELAAFSGIFVGPIVMMAGIVLLVLSILK
jgi:hypothetical protein